MHQSLLTVAIIGYVAATGLALAYLVQREELLHRLALLATLSAWVVHTVALLALAIDLGRPPLASMPEAVSVAVWVVVLLEMWIERRYGLNGYDVVTLDELAGELGVTRERVRQIQGEAIDKLRGRIARRGLDKEDFL